VLIVRFRLGHITNTALQREWLHLSCICCQHMCFRVCQNFSLSNETRWK